MKIRLGSRWLPRAAVVMTAATIVAMCAGGTAFAASQPGPRNMTNVENKRLDKALKAIKKLDRKAKVTLDDNVRSRKVISKKNWVVEVQDPAPGQAREAGSPVHLGVRKKKDPKLVAVPSLTDRSVREASDTAKRAGFKGLIVDGPADSAFSRSVTAVVSQVEQPGTLVRANVHLHVTAAAPEPPAAAEEPAAAAPAPAADPAPAPTAAPVAKTKPAPKAPATTVTPIPATAPKPAPESAPTVAAPASGCHPSYIGECLPVNASDVDCFGGGGDGPVYAMTKNIRVVGPDVYGLDSDHDGIACESK